MAAAAALAVWASAVAAQTAPESAVFGDQIDVNVVNVEVYVTGEDGCPVTGLKRGDFTLSEDGKPMQIINFEAVDPPAIPPAAPRGAALGGTAPEEWVPEASPLHLAVFIDNTQISASHRTRVLRQLADLLPRRLAPGDLVLLATFDPGLHVRLPFTADRNALAEALDALEKISADNDGDARARRFAWQQVLQTQELARLQLKKQMKTERSSRRKRGDEADGGDENGSENGSEEAGACPADLANPVKVYAQEVRQRTLSSIGGLSGLVSSLSGLPGRKALLHISDGISVTPGEDLFWVLNAMCADAQGTLNYHGSQAMFDAQSYSTAKQWSNLAARASAQRVTLYTLQASGLESSSTVSGEFDSRERLFQDPEMDKIQTENRRGSLIALADGTGGRAILDADDLTPDITRIEDDFGHYYSLGYAPPHQGDGRDHSVKVKISRAGTRVRHRKIYRDPSPLERMVDRTFASLFQGYEDNPLDIRLETGAGTPSSPGIWALSVRLSIPLSRLGLETRESSFDGKLRVLVMASGSDGAGAPVRQVEVPIRIPRSKALIALGQFYVYEVKMTLREGEQHLAVAVRDEATATTSYFARTLQVGAAESR